MSEDYRNQADKFRELARELDSDEDPAHFEETVRKIAPKAPVAKAPVAKANDK
jgi:hypothetical protein